MTPMKLAVAMAAAYMEDCCQDLDTDVQLGVFSDLEAEDLPSLATASRRLPRSTVGWTKLRQVEAFFKKCRNFADVNRCTQACYESFVKSEQQLTPQINASRPICSILNRHPIWMST
jgi:hypothetical protein